MASDGIRGVEIHSVFGLANAGERGFGRLVGVMNEDVKTTWQTKLFPGQTGGSDHFQEGLFLFAVDAIGYEPEV